jgi:hypothetical protein
MSYPLASRNGGHYSTRYRIEMVVNIQPDIGLKVCSKVEVVSVAFGLKSASEGGGQHCSMTDCVRFEHGVVIYPWSGRGCSNFMVGMRAGPHVGLNSGKNLLPCPMRGFRIRPLFGNMSRTRPLFGKIYMRDTFGDPPSALIRKK